MSNIGKAVFFVLMIPVMVPTVLVAVIKIHVKHAWNSVYNWYTKEE